MLKDICLWETRSFRRRLAFLLSGVTIGLLFAVCQMPAFCHDVVGDWNSEWGTVHLQNGGWRNDGTMSVNGYWDQKPGQRGTIKRGSYSSRDGRLWFDYFQPWNQQTGRATFVLNRSGTRLDGKWAQGNQSGAWTLTKYMKPTSYHQRNQPVYNAIPVQPANTNFYNTSSSDYLKKQARKARKQERKQNK